MNLTVILGAMALVGAIGVFWWGLTARPSAARANLFAGLPQPSTPQSKSDSIMRSLGQTTRRLLPNPLVDGLEVKLVQAGHPYGLDLPRILGIKIPWPGWRRSCWSSSANRCSRSWPPGCCSSCPTTGW